MGQQEPDHYWGKYKNGNRASNLNQLSPRKGSGIRYLVYCTLVEASINEHLDQERSLR